LFERYNFNLAVHDEIEQFENSENFDYPYQHRVNHIGEYKIDV